MGGANNVTEFILLGLTQNPKMQKIFFVLFLLIYLLTLVGNLLIVITIATSQTLSSPMYVFLSCLSFLDSCYSSSIGPKMIIDSLSDRKMISFNACMTQLFVEHLFAGAEIILLIVMAYDRYVAICKPLHYLTIMNSVLLLASWIGGFIHSLVQLLFIVSLPFCGPNVIDHFICDMYPLLELSCTDTCIICILVVANGAVMCPIFFLLLLISYGVIPHSLKTQSLEGQQKALSTCISHITVVVFFFIPCIFMYVMHVCTFPLDKSLTVFYTIITPMLKPLIYTLRNTEMKNVMRKLWNRNVMSSCKVMDVLVKQ
uniref:Olfactory receptor n=1 Tax=Vombatus ursinus TaxID=29139 RepID=A0A4X2LJQ5_VOMUR